MGKMKTSFVGDDKEKNKTKGQKTQKTNEEKAAVVDASPVEVADKELVRTSDKVKKLKEHVRGKKYKESKTKFDHEKFYSLTQAVKLVKDSSYTKFDGTMELHLTVKKAGTSVTVNLPHQAGRVKKVEVADENTVEKLKKGVVDFDILVATQVMMPKLVPFARLLGPRGLMPNPKNGTLVADDKQAQKFSTGSVTLKTEKDAPLIHTVIGKVSQKDEEIAENAEAILKSLGGSKQVVKAFMTASMSPSVKLLIK